MVGAVRSLPPNLSAAKLFVAEDIALHVVDGQCALEDLGRVLRELAALSGVFRVEFGPLGDALQAEAAVRGAGLPALRNRSARGSQLAREQPDRWQPGGELAVECGEPSVALVVRTHGLGHRRSAVLDALRGGRAFADVGVFDVGSRDAAVVETTDIARAPLLRTLAVLEIEAKRYGGTVAAATLISRLPLAALLGTLAARMPLAVAPAQVLETHLTGGDFDAANASDG